MKIFWIIGIVLLMSACNSPQEKLIADIRGYLPKDNGIYAVAYLDISSGEKILLHEHETFHAASTMKTPVMIEVYKQAAEGKFSLTDSIEIKNEFKSIVDGSPFSLKPEDDSEPEIYKMIGKKKTIYDVLYGMIIASSNLATNILIEKVDARNVMETMRSYGAHDIKVLRGVEDTKAFRQGLNNQVTANDLMLVFDKIARGEAVSPEASEAMVKILLDQKFNDIIPAQLPKDVRVAHKTGWITGLHHDSGIVMLPNGKKYVLVLLSKELKDEKAGVESLATVSKMIYDYANQPR
ncbi:MAG TPA: class A beta-lactamase-related serine hydrolase [Cyclobacteriaceae bacterium]|nr:class A beta-lactamase-related serine hydrolase [Cyclobacteriaceae bacterium]